ncbi:hypothetical protein MITS9509_02450 [Synechococcus sp. MIT S9509]|nr:hypothetical protein MITS9504_02270 [Synechococcus sp. MIT S9504]KZR91514.1 hypothetical protein MITS9509_02450 [Synechococcus sp. MIT S9509]
MTPLLIVYRCSENYSYAAYMSLDDVIKFGIPFNLVFDWLISRR